MSCSWQYFTVSGRVSHGCTLDRGRLHELVDVRAAEVGHANVLQNALLLELLDGAPGLRARRCLARSVQQE
jgi:hypothetical protein